MLLLPCAAFAGRLRPCAIHVTSHAPLLPTHRHPSNRRRPLHEEHTESDRRQARLPFRTPQIATCLHVVSSDPQPNCAPALVAGVATSKVVFYKERILLFFSRFLPPPFYSPTETYTMAAEGMDKESIVRRELTSRCIAIVSIRESRRQLVKVQR